MKNERDIFQNLDGFEVAPSAQAWGKLEKRLGPEKQRKAVVLWRVAAAVALLLMGSGALYLGSKQQSGPDQTVAQATKPAVLRQAQPAEATKSASAVETEHGGGNGAMDTHRMEVIAQNAPAETASPRMEVMKQAARKASSEETSPQIASAQTQKEARQDVKQVPQGAAPATEQQIAQAQQSQLAQQPVEPQVTPTPEVQTPVVAQAETPATGHHLEPVSFTMELKPTRDQTVETEEPKDRPLLAKLVKSADDVASGRVKGRDLLNRGTTALNSFLNRGRHSADQDSDKN